MCSQSSVPIRHAGTIRGKEWEDATCAELRDHVVFFRKRCARDGTSEGNVRRGSMQLLKLAKIAVDGVGEDSISKDTVFAIL